MKYPRLAIACAALALAVTTATVTPPPAYAITVFDPANYSQNLLTAVRNLQQINNQIAQLANEAQMLVNQARELTSLPTSVAGELQASLGQVDNLIRDAQGIAYDVSEIDREYQRLFPEEYASSVATSRIVQDAQEAWQNAREGFRHSLHVQAEVVGQVRTDAATLDRLIAESQDAVGNLQAVQAGNQLTALAAKQSMQLQTLLAASARADALESARAVATREQARARFERFMGDGSSYTR
ncbi:P-type conjugative transfer protein TrbJ [uncultured Roseobacter sp.]|uniref:P-type conjugative transfer protein TrbJ n=1 Tax=uncultured Roseobacter sp. TaxID=114847 RepID=UPI0026049789|nr:P-type conjugative transfer protein TrbJ [uncultured Roseobacter sp.]